MAEQPQTQIPINPYDFLGIVHNSDDILTRLIDISSVYDIDQSVTKDVPLNPARKTWLRLFLPNQEPGSITRKLPIVLYFHGGGFILCSAANIIFHNFCTSLANKLSAFIISVDYRLAPENRLPAAYYDALEAINWIRNQALDVNGENWVRKLGDISKCFLMGCSSGGNIAYHASLRAHDLDIQPVNIKGVILNQPFFGRVKRSGSEMRLMNDQALPLVVSDLMWELALPRGADRDHEYCNPGQEEKIGLMERRMWFVSVRCGDPLMDHQMEFVRILEGKGGGGGCVVEWCDDDEKGYHGMELFEPQRAEALFAAFRDFISSAVE